MLIFRKDRDVKFVILLVKIEDEHCVEIFYFCEKVDFPIFYIFSNDYVLWWVDLNSFYLSLFYAPPYSCKIDLV
jgi:hypothetical protein